MVFERFVHTVAQPADITIAIAPGARGGLGVSIEQDGSPEAHTFPDEDRLFGYVYARVLDQVTRRDARLLCVHAAALARSGRAVVVAAESGHGKSTLTLALAACGFTFLSDEVAAIERDSLRVRPFPMALGCRSGTARMLQQARLGEHGFVGLGRAGKLFLCPPVHPAAAPTVLDSVFFLEHPPEADPGPQRYRLALEPWHAEAVRRLGQVEGVRLVSQDEHSGEVVVELAAGAWVAPRVEPLLCEAGVLVAAVERLGTQPPDFASEPRLTRLRTVDGVLGLLRHLRGFGVLADLSGASADGFGGLVAALAARMRAVRFHRITPGRLEALVAAIDAATAQGST